MERPSWAPVGVETQLPSVTRAYEPVLGGSHDVAVWRPDATEHPERCILYGGVGRER